MSTSKRRLSVLIVLGVLIAAFLIHQHEESTWKDFRQSCSSQDANYYYCLETQ